VVLLGTGHVKADVHESREMSRPKLGTYSADGEVMNCVNVQPVGTMVASSVPFSAAALCADA